jgi:tetratricopeptide (TPR) repeat protein
MKRLVISLVLFMTVFFTNTYCLSETSTTEIMNIFQEGKFEEVISKARKKLQHHPDNLVINLQLGKALTERLRFAEAIPYLEKVNNGCTTVNMKGSALNYLGRCYFAMNIPAESKAKLKECLELETPKNIVDDAAYWYNLFGFNERFSNWSTISTEHFVFHFEQPSKVADINQLVSEHENSFSKINSFFKVKIPRKIHYFIWNSDELMKVFNTPGGFTKSEYCVIHVRYFQSVGHEMTHVFSYYISSFPYRVGLINEGIAVYFDQSGRDQLKLARWLLAEHNIHGVSIRELWNDWKRISMDDSYPLAGAFVKYLIEHGGEAKFKRLLADQRIENARRISEDGLICSSTIFNNYSTGPMILLK